MILSKIVPRVLFFSSWSYELKHILLNLLPWPVNGAFRPWRRRRRKRWNEEVGARVIVMGSHLPMWRGIIKGVGERGPDFCGEDARKQQSFSDLLHTRINYLLFIVFMQRNSTLFEGFLVAALSCIINVLFGQTRKRIRNSRCGLNWLGFPEELIGKRLFFTRPISTYVRTALISYHY